MKVDENATVADLRALAKKSGLSGYSKMKKKDLIAALKKSAGKTSSVKTPRKVAKKEKRGAAVKAAAAKSKTKMPTAATAKAAKKNTGTTVAGEAIRTKREATVPEKTETPFPPAALFAGEAALKKFDIGTAERKVFEEDMEELPDSYGQERLVLLPRDSNYLFCFWDVSDARVRELSEKAGDGRTVLRITSLRGGFSFDEELSVSARRYHIKVPEAASGYFVELGVVGAGGRFYPLLRSNTAFASEDSPSFQVDKPLFVTIPFDIPLKKLTAKGIVSFGGYISHEGRFLTEDKYIELLRQRGGSLYKER